MNLKLKYFFIIFLILLFAIQVQADAPILYNKELASDVELRGTFFTNDNADGFYVSLIGENSIQIVSDIHHIDKTIKMKKTALDSRFKKFNGIDIGITHISDDGIVNNYILPVVVDGEFVYITVDFSTVIINGMTGTTTTTLTGLSGNQSISVPDGSSYDLNITNNQEGVYSVNGYDWEYQLPHYQDTTAAFTDAQYEINNTNFPILANTFNNISTDENGLPIVNLTYSNETNIPFWVEYWNNVSSFKIWTKTTSGIENLSLSMYYGGGEGLSAGSNGSDVFEEYFDKSSTLGWSTSGGLTVTTSGDWLRFYNNVATNSGVAERYDLVLPTQYIMEAHLKTVSLGSDNMYVMLLDGSSSNRKAQNILPYNNGNYYIYDGSVVYVADYTQGTEYILKNVIDDSDATTGTDYYLMDTSRNVLGSLLNKNTGVGTVTDTDGLYIGDFATPYTIDAYFKYIVFRQYTATEPTYTIGTPQTAKGIANITASITDDSNTQSYNTSQSREFTLTPTGETNNVLINTTSTDYDVTVTTYWTENTTLQTETAAAGYAKQYINYTPSFNVTSADLNTTFTFNFSAQDYIGTATSTLNDVSKTTTRDGQDVNASVGSLTGMTPYWWNVTAPYNNIFTLSGQADHTAYLGIAEQFTDSTYSDPEGLPIDTRLWKFGDGDTSNSSNPSHKYTTVSDFNANYSVTETATVSPQTILREFNVSVEVQPVQNLTSTPDINHIHFDWDNYSSADYWNISRLDITIPFTLAYPILDGIEDACYECCCAYGFVGDAPNPHTDYGKELIYILRNSTFLMLYADGEDNDGLNNDDNFLIGIDASNNNLSTDDRKFILNEGGTVTAKRWSGSAWLPIATTAQGAVVGGGTPGAIQYEMFIPISELDTNFTNGSTVKFFMSRTHTASTPDIESYYPQGLINTTDATLWQSVLLSETPQYTYINNTSTSDYTVTGLDPFTWYQHRFVAINGSQESSSVDSSDITSDVPSYSISGYIKDISGNPIANADVWGENGYPLEHNVSNASGYYIGTHFHNGTYTIYANATGYLQNNSGVVTVAGANLTNVNITLIVEEEEEEPPSVITTIITTLLGSTATGLISEGVTIGAPHAKYTLNIAGIYDLIFDFTESKLGSNKILDGIDSIFTGFEEMFTSFTLKQVGSDEGVNSFWTVLLLFFIALFLSGITNKNPKIKAKPAATIGFVGVLISSIYLGLFAIVI